MRPAPAESACCTFRWHHRKPRDSRIGAHGPIVAGCGTAVRLSLGALAYRRRMRVSPKISRQRADGGGSFVATLAEPFRLQSRNTPCLSPSLSNGLSRC